MKICPRPSKCTPRRQLVPAVSPDPLFPLRGMWSRRFYAVYWFLQHEPRNSCSQNRGCFLAHVGGLAVPTASQRENRGSINIRKYQENCPLRSIPYRQYRNIHVIFGRGRVSPIPDIYLGWREMLGIVITRFRLSVCVLFFFLYCFSVYLSSVVPLCNLCLSLFFFQLTTANWCPSPPNISVATGKKQLQTLNTIAVRTACLIS